MNTIYLSLGSNSGERVVHLKKILSRIHNQAGKITAISPVYETTPWGFASKDMFLNLAVQIESDLRPHNLLHTLQDIEQSGGKQSSRNHYKIRTADIDILLYNDIIMTDKDLVVPHPLMHLRAFCIIPLSDIAGQVLHPVFRKKIREFVPNFCKDQSIRLYLHQNIIQF